MFPEILEISCFKVDADEQTLTLKWRAWWRRRANGPARAVRQWCRLKQAGSFRPLPRISRWLQRLHQGLPACESAHTPLSVAKRWKARATSWDGILPLTMGKRKRPLFVSPRSPLDPVCKQEILETLHIRSATDDARRAGWRATIILGRTRRGKTFADEKCSRVSRRTTRHLDVTHLSVQDTILQLPGSRPVRCRKHPIYTSLVHFEAIPNMPPHLRDNHGATTPPPFVTQAEKSSENTRKKRKSSCPLLKLKNGTVDIHHRPPPGPLHPSSGKNNNDTKVLLFFFCLHQHLNP